MSSVSRRFWGRRFSARASFRRSFSGDLPAPARRRWPRLIAERTEAQFIALSAVLAGVREVRAAIDEARKSRRRDRRTILFIDEIHRFNKGQQDALLGAVEDGTVTLIGATTENPSFEVNAALLSRCRVVVLQPLSPDEIATIICRALGDPERGLAEWKPLLAPGADRQAGAVLGGDARVALSALEEAVAATVPGDDGDEARHRADRGRRAGTSPLRLRQARRRPLQPGVRLDQVGAKLRRKRRLVLAGPDDRGGRRPDLHRAAACILASEDVGLADPQAMVQAAAAAQITHLIGLPKPSFPLAQATIYLAQAPKSNRIATAYQAAVADAVASAREPVPLHLRNAVTSLMKTAGYGQGYRYVHDDPRAEG